MIHAMSRSGNPFAAFLVVVGALALVGIPSESSAESPAIKKKKAPASKQKAKQQVEVPKIDLGGLGGLPQMDGIEMKRAGQDDIGPRVTTKGEVKYEVLDVVHATGFTRTADGTKPAGEALRAIQLHGRPPVTQQFTTLVKVKATQSVNASIDVVILDPRGDTALSGSGNLSFAHSKTGEVEWLIDWSPTPRAAGGNYKMLIRVAGRPMGTWPLQVQAP